MTRRTVPRGAFPIVQAAPQRVPKFHALLMRPRERIRYHCFNSPESPEPFPALLPQSLETGQNGSGV